MFQLLVGGLGFRGVGFRGLKRVSGTKRNLVLLWSLPAFVKVLNVCIRSFSTIVASLVNQLAFVPGQPRLFLQVVYLPFSGAFSYRGAT